MACLGSAIYDPAGAVSKATSSLLALTALDTTNLRVTFTAPANGKVLVRLKTITTGSATVSPSILLGILESATVKGRIAPSGGRSNLNVITKRVVQDASFVVTGLTPGNSYTWDAAYGVEVLAAATNIKYGGPNNTTTDDAWGAFVFEVWEANNLLAGTLYDPGTAVSKATSSLLAITALDTTNLRLTFTGPTSGRVWVRMGGPVEGGTTFPAVQFAALDGATIKGRVHAQELLPSCSTIVATDRAFYEGSFIVSGLVAGTSYTWDAAYGVEVVVASSNLKYGGPNNTTTDDAWGGFVYEIWSA